MVCQRSQLVIEGAKDVVVIPFPEAEAMAEAAGLQRDVVPSNSFSIEALRDLIAKGKSKLVGAIRTTA